jgi:hypothetical protein
MPARVVSAFSWRIRWILVVGRGGFGVGGWLDPRHWVALNEDAGQSLHTMVDRSAQEAATPVPEAVA